MMSIWGFICAISSGGVPWFSFLSILSISGVGLGPGGFYRITSRRIGFGLARVHTYIRSMRKENKDSVNDGFEKCG